MIFTDTYQTIAHQSSGEFKDKGSKFLAFAFPVETEDAVKEQLTLLKKEHFSAAHHCYAYVIGKQNEVQKSNDDREPNNTAGKPILRAILSHQLTNVLVVVVRYFGGKLLGVPGLIHAYGEAAHDCLKNAEKVEQICKVRYEVQGEYENENELYKAYKQFDAKLITHSYNESLFCSIFEIRKSKAQELVQHLNDKRLFELSYVSES